MNLSQVQNLLASSDLAVKNGLLVLLGYQTEDEKAGSYTGHTNGKGFNKFNAKIGTSLANKVKKGRELTSRQLEAARNICLTHARQLAQVAERLQQEIPEVKPVKYEPGRNPWNVPVILKGEVITDTYSHVMVRFIGKDDLVRLPKKMIMWTNGVFVVPLKIANSSGLNDLNQCEVS